MNIGYEKLVFHKSQFSEKGFSTVSIVIIRQGTYGKLTINSRMLHILVGLDTYNICDAKEKAEPFLDPALKR